MDLSTVTRKNTVEVEIYTTTGVKTDIVITLFSPGTKKFKQASFKVTDDLAKKKTVGFSAEERDINKHRLAAEITESWVNLDEGGGPVELTVDNALDVYLRHDWIYNQIETELGDQNNFLDFAL